MTDHDKALNCLQQIVMSLPKADLSSAEIYRMTAESNIKNALHYGDFEVDERRRLIRLVSSLEAASNQSSQKKLDLLQDTVVSTIINLGLIVQR